MALPGKQTAQVPTGWRFVAITRRSAQAQMWYHYPEGTTTTDNIVLQGLDIGDAKYAEDDWIYLGSYPGVKAVKDDNGQNTGEYEPTTVLVFLDP